MHTITITSLRDDGARREVLRYLTSRLSGFSEADVAGHLDKLPLIVTRWAPTASAREIVDILERSGATVRVRPPMDQPATGPAAGPGLKDSVESTARVTGQTLPGGAMCANHPALKADGTCARCGKVLCAMCMTLFEGVSYCVSCLPVVRAASDEKGDVDWENRETLGFYPALSGTWKKVMLSPGAFFNDMPRAGGHVHPLLFAVIWATIGTWGILLWDLILSPRFGTGAYIAGLVFAPVTVTLNLYIMVTIFHRAVLIVGGNGSFESTFRILAYTSAADVFQLIPVAGILIATAYQLGLAYIGFRSIHELTPGRAVLAVLMALFFLFMVGLVVGFAIMYSRDPYLFH